MTDKKLDLWAVLRTATGLGFIIALPISGGTVLGFILDQKFGMTPILTIVFLLMGLILSIFSLFRKIKDIQDASH